MTVLTPFGDWPVIKPQAILERRQRPSNAMNGPKPFASIGYVHHLRLPYVQCLRTRRNEFRHVCALSIWRIPATVPMLKKETCDLRDAVRRIQKVARILSQRRLSAEYCLEEVQDYRIKHLSFFFFLVKSAALVADSKTSRTPWFVLAEHSRYL